MNFLLQSIPGPVLIKPNPFVDKRGFFLESYRRDLFKEKIGYDVNFVQDNESKSMKGVLRGLHFQLPPDAQSKLVRVIHGIVLDIAVDIRKASPTFGKHIAVELNEFNKHQLFIPKGFAHGFVVLSDTAIFSYKVDSYYSPSSERGIAFDDEQLAIDWMLPKKDIKLSKKDQNYPKLKDLEDCFL